MKRSTAMLVGAATVALAAGTANLSPVMANPIPAAASYADLLEPVPNAMERLAADDANQPATRLQPAQYQDGGQDHHHHHQQQYRQYDQNGGQGYHHHHHHQQEYRNYDDNRGSGYHHHHHHSRRWYQANGYYWSGGRWIVRPAHHHHHHHHHYNNGY